MFCDNKASALAADSVTPRVARPPATIVVYIQDKLIPVFREDEFQQPTSS